MVKTYMATFDQAGGGGRGGGDGRGVDENVLQSATRKSSPCRHSKNHPKQAVPHPNLPGADVDAHLGRVLRRLDDHRQQAHTSAHVQTPPPTLKML